MRATCIVFYKFGAPRDVLKVVEKMIQLPLEGEVLVKMNRRPISPSDLIPIRGAYAHRISLPMIPGYEGVGIVEEVGAGVSNGLIGQRVLPLRGEGTWQDYVKTSANLVVPIPNSIGDDTAAQLYINPLTAWLTCTEVLRLKPGDTLLVNACGSSIGRIYAQLSQILGFRLIAVTRNDVHTEALLQLGAEYVINTTETSLHHAVMEMTNGCGATAAIDSIGGAAGKALAFCVRPHGILLTIGLLSGVPVNWTVVSKQAKVQVKLFHLRHWNERVSVHTWQATFNHLIELIEQKKLSLMNPKFYYHLGDIQQAVSMADASKGKVFLTSM